MSDKKDQERRDLEWLKKSKPEIFGLEWEDREPPDFASRLKGKNIGLEFTRLAGEETQRESLIGRVRDLCMSRSKLIVPNPSRINVFCDYQKWPLRDKREEIADAIVKSIAAVYKGEKMILGRNHFTGILQEYPINRIELSPWSKYRDKAHWSFPQFGFIRRIGIEYLQKIIADKNETLSKYRDQFDEVWLVIWLQKFGASSFVELPELPLELNFDFDRVFVFANSTKNLIEVTRKTPRA